VTVDFKRGHDAMISPAIHGATMNENVRDEGECNIEGTRRMVIETARPGSFAAAALAILAAIILGVAVASPHRAAAGEEHAAATQYLPSISDLMIATIQPRHRRLWRAAQNGDWEFAAYELGNLKGAFKRLGEAHPTEHDISFSEIIASVTGQPFAELGSAIKAKDGAAFVKAYAALTNECNSCHQALNHGVVVIRVPDGKSASDQDFTGTTP
jgi:hypothetical protein